MVAGNVQVKMKVLLNQMHLKYEYEHGIEWSSYNDTDKPPEHCCLSLQEDDSWTYGEYLISEFPTTANDGFKSFVKYQIFDPFQSISLTGRLVDLLIDWSVYCLID